jgi:DNA-binding beta-propeller fold protein YncE
MWGKRPFAIAYNPTTNHILVVAAANNELHIIWPGGYSTGNVWTLLPQNEGDEWHGGQGIDTSGHDVWVTNYADGSVSILFDPM